MKIRTPETVCEARTLKTLLLIAVMLQNRQDDPNFAELHVRIPEGEDVWCMQRTRRRNEAIPGRLALLHLFVPRNDKEEVTFYNFSAFLTICIKRSRDGTLSYSTRKGTFGQLFCKYQGRLRKIEHIPEQSQAGMRVL